MTIKKLLEIADKLQGFDLRAAMQMPSSTVFDDIDLTTIDFHLFKQQKIDQCDNYLKELRDFALGENSHPNILNGIEDIRIRVVDRSFRIMNDFQLSLDSETLVEGEINTMIMPLETLMSADEGYRSAVWDLLYLDELFIEGLDLIIKELKSMPETPLLVNQATDTVSSIASEKETAAKHKILLLHKLGVLDYLKNECLKPKDSKIYEMELARVVSEFTGIKFNTTVRVIKGIYFSDPQVLTKTALNKVNDTITELNDIIQ